MSFPRLHVGSRAWNGSRNGSFGSPSAASAINAIVCGIRVSRTAFGVIELPWPPPPETTSSSFPAGSPGTARSGWTVVPLGQGILAVIPAWGAAGRPGGPQRGERERVERRQQHGSVVSAQLAHTMHEAVLLHNPPVVGSSLIHPTRSSNVRSAMAVDRCQ